MLAIVPTLVLAAAPAPTWKPVPLASVEIRDLFWAPRIERNRRTTIPYCLRVCEATGRIRNFERAAGLAPGGYEGLHFNDSDVYKIVEGASYALALTPDPALAQDVDRVIGLFAAAQRPDGYLNTFITLVQPQRRWTDIRSPARHELYCAGHLIEAGVAHFEMTRDRRLLDVAQRLADHIQREFGSARRRDVPEHQEIELALIRLARATGDARYRDLAAFFVDERGNAKGHTLYGRYAQDHLPVREQDEVVGHAVRAMYGACAMADLAAETGDAAILEACRRLWRSATERKMYVTGGIGARHAGESFGDDYELPNESAYAETCAAIGLVLFAHRMLLLEGDAAYADTLERALYNAVLAGVSLSGDRFFYVNPLASRGAVHRQPWFDCACCPSNIVRIIPAVGGLSYSYAGPFHPAYSPAPHAIRVHLYIEGKATIPLEGGEVALSVRTKYPWDGEVEIAVETERRSPFAIELRIPGWCEGARLRLDGEAIEAPAQRGYARIERAWKSGERIALSLPMPVRRIEAHPRVAAAAGRIAIERGPIVYCLEGVDHEGSVLRLALPREAELAPEPHPELLGGITVIRGMGLARIEEDDEPLYRPAGAARIRTAPIFAIPYFAWDNRAPGEMVVWVPEGPAALIPPSGAIPSSRSRRPSRRRRRASRASRADIRSSSRAPACARSSSRRPRR